MLIASVERHELWGGRKERQRRGVAWKKVGTVFYCQIKLADDELSRLGPYRACLGLKELLIGIFLLIILVVDFVTHT